MGPRRRMYVTAQDRLYGVLESHLGRHPKRITWGFDELQRLSETAMPTTEELFGRPQMARA